MHDTLSDDERTIVTARADQFRNALIQDGAGDWEPFLRGLTGHARLSLLVGLVVLDLGFRWGKGERPIVEDYIARFPELANAGALLPAIIVEEFRCRRRSGETIEASRFQERFPELFPAIQADLEAVGASWTISEETLQRWQPTAEGVVAVSQQYELVRELGRGQFGEVWLARKKPSGIEKAIKILLQPADKDAAQRELKSLELIKNLRHPYLLATEDFWVTNNRLHVAMELADGTLRGRLKHHLSHGHAGIPVDELYRYISEAAEGLDFLHANRITHRDVKPDNILILHGHAKLADFGLARAQQQMMESVSLAGTPAYMAPEVWSGEGGPASDQYALAFLYTELRQGRSPMKPRPFAELMKAHQTGDFEFSTMIPDTERAVLKKAMATNPNDRFPSCTAFVAELGKAVGLAFAGKMSQYDSSRPVLLDTILHGSTELMGSGVPASEIATLVPGGTEVIDQQVVGAGWKKRVPRGLIAVIALTLIAIPLGIYALRGNGDGSILRPSEQQLPAGTSAEPNTNLVTLAGGKSAPEWILFEKDGKAMRFRLIAPQAGPPTEPFYISETKITNNLYSGGDDAPAMNMTASEARNFAKAAFGGDLPSVDEWDQAAGFFDQQGMATPTLAPGRAWIGKAAPGPVKRPTNESDSNRYGLLDIAGNGREWTRTVITTSGTTHDLAERELQPGDKLILRGRMFTLDRPLSYAILDMERKQQPQAATAAVGSPYTGFRVVLKLP